MFSNYFISTGVGCSLRACSVGTVPFRSATVSIVKKGSFRFEAEGNGPFV